MYRGSDSVFRLSLVGIAFIFMFFLLIIFGRAYSDARAERAEALARLNQQQQQNAQPEELKALESALGLLRQDVRGEVQGKNLNADEILRDIRDKSRAETELAALKLRVQELNAQLEGFAAVRETLAQVGKSPVLSGTKEETILSALELRARLEQKLLSPAPTTAQPTPELADDEIVSQASAAIDFKRNISTLVENMTGQPLVPGQEATWMEWFAGAQLQKTASQPARTDQGKESDTTLRAQLNFLLARLKAHGDTFSPPCWFDNAGNVQPLLTVTLKKNGNVTITKAWPNMREVEARAISGLNQLVARGESSTMTYAAFAAHARTIAQSNKQCHYSVQVKDELRSGKHSEKIHQEIESFFHLDLPR